MIFSELNPGKSVEGSEIESFRSELQGDKYLYLLAGTHGDEVEGVYVLQQLFDWLKDDHTIKELPIIVVPILNPDGYRAQSRVNSQGVDLNRNYPTDDWSADYTQEKYNPGSGPLSEPENIYLDKLFRKFKPGFILSFHSWKPVLNYNNDAQDVAEYLASYNMYPIAGDIGYPTPGSLGTYAPQKYQAPVLTFECPVLKEELTLQQIWQDNEKGLKNLLQSELLAKKLH